MRIQIGYKFILGFVLVVAVVAFSPEAVRLLGYSEEITKLLTYVVALTIGLILGWIFSKTFTKNISHLTESAEFISQGDLTRNVEIGTSRFPDETYDIGCSINRMVENLRELVRNIRGVAEKVSVSARTLSCSAQEINASGEEVAHAMEQISCGAENQAGMAGKSAKIIHDMAISIELVAKRARETSAAARETSRTAQRGGYLANDSFERMKNILENVEVAGRQFMEFNAKLQRVGKIADFISDIARQTNMLALNASIEAARAGEYGKGFAVVADEVRKLADGTGKSAEDIMELIRVIREESRLVQAAIMESSKQISEGRKNIDVTGTSFQEIVCTVLETERKANSIADLSAIQTEDAKKMVGAVDEFAKMAEDNATSTEEVSAATEQQTVAMHEMSRAAQELAMLSDELLRSVERFTISSDNGNRS
ncbi:MAG TPA: methyl-accepting chemotaxis protein [Geobacteraceae bacterium]|nr:methyl-accepting chemotaxis protein [Geobacteraceae bacterium]